MAPKIQRDIALFVMTSGLKKYYQMHSRMYLPHEYLSYKSKLTVHSRAQNWLREHPILRLNFVSWMTIHGVADGEFQGILTIDEALATNPPKGRES